MKLVTTLFSTRYFHHQFATGNLELNATRKLIESVTGRSTILFRPPFNADAEPTTLAEVIPVAESKSQSYINIGESIDPWDWQPGVTADSIIARTIRQKMQALCCYCMMPVAIPAKKRVKALPTIIHFFKSHGYKFTTIADVLGKTKADLMPPIRDDANSGILGTFYNILIQFYFYGNWFYFTCFYRPYFWLLVVLF